MRRPRPSSAAALRRAALAAALAAASIAPASIAPAWAVQPDEILPDRALETRARHISSELRCLVCQNQSIDDSDAPLARDLRVLVRERLQGGQSDEQVRAFLVARYGDFVLLKPPVTWNTALLWLAPLAILVTALSGLILAIRRRPAGTIRDEPLTRAEAERIRQLSDDPA